MRRSATVLLVALALALTGSLPATAGPGHHHSGGRWQQWVVPSKESLRGLDAVNRRIAWAAGDGGGVWRTTDAGRTWQDVAPPGSDDLLFRDVEAFGSRTAVVMAIGEGDASRIYRTDDGGRSWRTSFVNDDPKAFYDCLDFWPGGRRGLAMSDPVDGRFRVLATRDGGRSWRVLPSDGMPAADPAEFGFAASGTCLEVAGRRDAWIGSGGGPSRIYHSRDGGLTWRVTDSTIPGSAAGGVFSIAFDGPHRGVAVGGDFEDEANGLDASATSTDGDTWTNAGDLGGYRSGVDWVGHRHRTLVATGPSGTDLSTDRGHTWSALSSTGYHAVACVSDGTCWTSGSGGRIGRLTLRH